jgi:hypothetical protein
VLDDDDDVYDVGSIIDDVLNDVVGDVVDTVNVELVAVNVVDASLAAVDVNLGTVSVSLAAVSAKLFVAGVEFAAVTVFTAVDAVLSIFTIFLDGLFSPLLLSPSDCAITRLLTAPALIMQKMEMIKTLRTIFTLNIFL